MVEASTLEPLVKPVALESTRRAVSAPGVPLKLAAGWKRTLVPAARYKAVASARPEVAMSVHVEAFSHCHLPCAEVAALAVIATPVSVLAELPPVIASVESLKLFTKSAETKAPVGAAVSSLTAAKLADPVAIGASLMAVILVLKATVPLL